MRQNFTDEEWATLLQAPLQGVMAVVLADRVDPVSFLQELVAGVRIVEEELQRTDIAGELAPLVSQAMGEIDAQDPLDGEQLLLKKEFELLGLIQTFKSAKEGKQYAIEHFRKAADILERKVAGIHATDCKRWLMSIAQKTAEAQKEGGFLGIGASRVSEKESDILKDLAKALKLEF
jgi:hypothetical protein